MKRFHLLITSLIIICTGMFQQNYLHAYGKNSYVIPMKTFLPGGTGYNEEGDPTHREYPDCVTCMIDSSRGVEIDSVNSGDIFLYEIYDSRGNLIASFDQEQSFIKMLFTISGEFQLKFYTPDHCYVGLISL